MKAEKCPVCNGTGKYVPPQDPYCTAVVIEQPCHGCNGKGWVEVNESTIYPTYYPPYSPLPPYYSILLSTSEFSYTILRK